MIEATREVVLKTRGHGIGAIGNGIGGKIKRAYQRIAS